MNIREIEKKYFLLCGMKAAAEKELAYKKGQLEACENKIMLVQEAQAFLQKVAQDTQSQLKFQIEDIVNLALETCFPAEYEFKLDFNISRGRTDASLVFKSQKTGRIVDPMNASGGGVVDLTAFALRIAAFALERGADNVIILDEPFRFISRDLQARAGELLEKLSEKLKLQIIMVTHINDMIDIADKVFTVRKVDGVSIVKSKKML